MNKQKNKQVEAPIPTVLMHKGETWDRGTFLGKGGFGRCYELINEKTGAVVAGKIVPKTLLVKQHQKDKMLQEIQIHRGLQSTHCVEFITHFEDSNYYYVLLELCRWRSLMELMKRRVRLTIPEAQYFLVEVLRGVVYLHDNKIIHRDLKLANILINEDIHVKIGDFGLATVLKNHKEVRLTVCGTPNYIAPEIVAKEGHSYAADMWSVGCILYCLLVGKAPFETTTLTSTYEKIRRVEYTPHVDLLSAPGYDLLKRLFVRDPRQRLTARQCLEHPFLTDPTIPRQLPDSILTTAPRFVVAIPIVRPVVQELQAPAQHAPDANQQIEINARHKESLELLDTLHELLRQLLDANPRGGPLLPIDEDVAANPAAAPVYWVSKWVDYTDKYGLGYQLCDDSIAVLFNDKTRMLLMSDGKIVCFIDESGREHFHTCDEYPEDLHKKMLLINYFQSYMSRHLVTTGADVVVDRGMDMARIPYVECWFRRNSAVVLFLSNGTLQINFFNDHTKVILCPLMEAVSYIDRNGQFRTYSLRTLFTRCPHELLARLECAEAVIDRVRRKVELS